MLPEGAMIAATDSIQTLRYFYLIRLVWLTLLG